MQTCINLITNKEYAVKVSTPSFVFMLGLFWTMCSAQGACGLLFVLGFFCVPFFSPDCAEVDIVSSPLPLLFSFCGSLWECREEYTHPLYLPELPAGVASSENIVYWRLCQNKNPQRGRRGAEELRLCVYTALYSVHLHFFYFSSPGWVWTCFTSWNFPFCVI